MGPRQHTLEHVGRSNSRACLRKGCGRIFQAVRWNQRYCREPDCLREVHRWQAAKRQRAYRQSPANRERHAEAERRRRARAKRQPSAADSANPASADNAWSRSKANSKDFCNRPGCYEPLPTATRAPARYCGSHCRQAVRRVLDRERKWLLRHVYARREPSNKSTRASSSEPLSLPSRIAAAAGENQAPLVGNYRAAPQQPLSSSRFDSQQAEGEAHVEHSKTHSGRRSRPPPSG